MKDKELKYTRTDLACECIDPSEPRDGVFYTEEQLGDIRLLHMRIENESEAARIGKPCGEYLTFLCLGLAGLDDASAEALSSLLAAELMALAEKRTKKPLDGELCVLVAGLGNADMTPDAIGPETAARLTVTGHLSVLEPEVFASLGCARLYAIAPGVLGETGIEALELIKGAAEAVKPDLIIAVDALASRDASRLASTVQLADSGISPGSGVHNRRREISQKTLGVPVIALGVPTVVDSATLAADILGRAGTDPSETGIFEGLEPLFVAPRDIDLVIERASAILASAIDTAFGINRADGEYN